jgi:putative SOS response-associated peptidase YedK
MCGRFTIAVSYDELKSYVSSSFGIDVFAFDADVPRYNVAPGEDVIAIIHDGIKYRIGQLRWGFVPKGKAPSSIKPINARSETVTEKPMFKEAISRHRCVILADGFYEWKKEDSKRIPYRCVMKNPSLFAMAGLYSITQRDDGTKSSSLILTTKANDLMQDIHDRMPVILDQQGIITWLSRTTQIDDLSLLMKPYEASKMNIYPVTSRIGHAGFKDAKAIEDIRKKDH